MTYPRHPGALAARLVCVLAAAGVCAAAAPRPVPGAAEAAFAKARQEAGETLRRLEQLRVRPGEKAEQVAGLAKYADGVLADAERLLAAERDRLKAELPARPPRPAASQPKVSAVRLLQIRRCEASLLRGEVHLAAARALPAAHADRKKHLDEAVGVFRWLRIEFRRLPLGLMGYVAEARAQRLLGDVKAAVAALEPVLNLPQKPNDPAGKPLRLAGLLESLYIEHLLDNRRAIASTEQWLTSPELAGEGLWIARAEWALARFRLAELAAQPKGAKPPPAEIARTTALLRKPSVVKVAPAFDRLELLAKLDDLTGGKCMTRDELLSWAGLLAGAGRVEAEAIYRRLWSQPGRPLSADAMLAYASLLWKRDDRLGAADVCDEFIRRFAPGHARSNVAIQFRALALLKARQAAADKKAAAELRARLLDALAVAVESSLPDDVRRDALRQWVALRLEIASPYGEMLSRHADLVASDAYLLYADASRRWRMLAARIAAGSLPAEPAAKEADEIAAVLAAARKAAQADRQSEIAAKSVLLRARLLAGRPLGDPRAALQTLNGNWQLLQADASAAMPAAWLRVELMMRLGLLDAANEALTELRSAGRVGPGDVSLRLAEMLAARYAGADLAEAGKLQRKVLSLCNEALAGATAEAKRYAACARRVGRVMLKVQAYADAEFLLRRLLARPEDIADPQVVLDCSLMLAEALQQNRKTGEALERLELLARTQPRSADVFLAMGRCELKLSRPARAVTAFRRARKLTRRGGADWCRATLALADGLAAADRRGAAEDVLRVSQALFPAFGGAELKARLVQMRKSLGTLNMNNPM